MPHGFTLVLEDHADRPFATATALKSAVRMMAAPMGPTYIMLKGPYEGYAQAAGFDDRFRIEMRAVYGEGFRHWLAGSPNVKDRSDVVMYYRNHCHIHGRRRCPLPAWGENVLPLSAVLAILSHYHSTGARLAAYPWEDVSQSFIDEGLKGKSRFIRRILPRTRTH
jgi:hypothetical protein